MSLQTSLKAELTRVEGLDHKDLSQEWIKLIGSAPPKASSRKYLLCAVAYEQQCKRLSGLTKREQKVLSEHIKRSSPKAVSAKTKRASVALIPGSKLIREWNGRSYQVSVIEEGFVYQDKIWPSLSAIARDITGAHWSGPRFFGVDGRVHRVST